MSAATRLIVLTGGPGAGKSAVLEILRKMLREDFAFVPESAGIIYSGGFPRQKDPIHARCAQRAIFHVQRELERLAEEKGATVALCDRGTIDGLGYWPGDPGEFFRDLGTTREAELARYFAVIHLRTPEDGQGYNHSNPLRIETALEAYEIDQRIYRAWESHPRRFIVESSTNFIEKASQAVALIASQLTSALK